MAQIEITENIRLREVISHETKSSVVLSHECKYFRYLMMEHAISGLSYGWLHDKTVGLVLLVQIYLMYTRESLKLDNIHQDLSALNTVKYPMASSLFCDLTIG